MRRRLLIVPPGAKQKQKMQRLEAMTIAALASSTAPPLQAGDVFNTSGGWHQEQTQTSQPSIHPEQTSAAPSIASSFDCGRIHVHDGADLSFSHVLALLRACTPRERQTFYIVLMRERFGLRDIIKYGLIQLGHAMNSALFESAQHASSRAWLAQVLSATGEVDILAAITAGVKLFAGFPLPERLLAGGAEEEEEEEAEEEVIRRVVFAPRATPLDNRITLSAVALGSALFANAILLGIPLAAMAEDDDVPMALQALRCTKPDLAPTSAQLAVPHHPSFDVMPWPVFRANICLAIAHDPPLIDDDELCLDIMNDGIRCWGSGAGDSLHGRGQGAPWDSRSWEAAPWFLEKWEGLTGGRDGDMWRNSEWWRAMRN
ncbi:hypothetical protein F5X97DRAFT_276998 [Nemania serpens]|nr:hypothetical protein F5X97DRAFT_276998 [Nemania serpens]